MKSTTTNVLTTVYELNEDEVRQAIIEYVSKRNNFPEESSKVANVWYEYAPPTMGAQDDDATILKGSLTVTTIL